MSESLQATMLYILLPVTVTMIGGVFAAYKSPGERTRITVQHFAAGVVFAAVALELLPELTQNLHLVPLVTGFSLGVALMLSVRWFSEKLEGESGSMGLVLAAAVDVFIDGLLMGISFDVGFREGIIVMIALSIELLFLALSVSASLGRQGAGTKKLIFITLLLSFLVLLGAGLGGTLLEGLSGGRLNMVIAFAVAALLYLVTEELLVEAHKVGPDTAFSTTMFFLGFLIVMILESATT